MASVQKVGVWITTAAFVGAGLYPPWVSVWGSAGQFRRPAGYHSLFQPPSEMAVQVDISLLLIQWAIIVAAGAALVWATPSIPVRRLTSIAIPAIGIRVRWLWSHVGSPALLLISILWFVTLENPGHGLIHRIKTSLDQFLRFEYWGPAAMLILLSVAGISDLRDWRSLRRAKRKTDGSDTSMM